MEKRNFFFILIWSVHLGKYNDNSNDTDPFRFHWIFSSFFLLHWKKFLNTFSNFLTNQKTLRIKKKLIFFFFFHLKYFSEKSRWKLLRATFNIFLYFLRKKKTYVLVNFFFSQKNLTKLEKKMCKIIDLTKRIFFLNINDLFLTQNKFRIKIIVWSRGYDAWRHNKLKKWISSSGIQTRPTFIWSKPG